MKVLMGNRSAHVRGEVVDDEHRVTAFDVPAGRSSGEAFADITAPGPGRGGWDSHSTEAPTWVACADNELLEALLAEHYGVPAGVPDDVEATHHTLHGPPGVGPDGPDATAETEDARP